MKIAVLVFAAVVATAGVAGLVYNSAKAQTETHDEWAERGISLRANAIECRFYTDAWDAGNKSLAEGVYGDRAANIMDSCRFMQNIYQSYLKQEPLRT